jgi:quercetin dioxygenase-like cupin family protein
MECRPKIVKQKIRLSMKFFNENDIEEVNFSDRTVRFAFGKQGKLPTRSFNLGIVEFKKGIVSLEHAHSEVDEVLYVHNGKATIMLDGKDISAGKGDFIYIPEKTKHRIITNKGFDVKILFMFSGEIKIDY